MINKKRFLSGNNKKDSLRKKLEEDYQQNLMEDDEDDSFEPAGDDEFGGEEEGTEDNFEGGDEFSDEGGDEDFGGDEDMEGGEDDEFAGEEHDFSYGDEEREFMDNETDELLEPAEEEAELSEEGEETDYHGDLSAEEIQSIIDSDDSYGELGSTLSTMADDDDEDFSDEEGMGDEEDFDSEGSEDDLEWDEEGSEEDFSDEEGMDDEYSDEDDFEGDELHEKLMTEAEMENEINEEVDKLTNGDEEDTMTEAKGAKQTYKTHKPKTAVKAGNQVKPGKTGHNKLKESEGGAKTTYTKAAGSAGAKKASKEVDQTEEEPKLEGTYSKVSNSGTSKGETKLKFSSVSKESTVKKVTPGTFTKVKQSQNESVQKSKMLVEASAKISKLEKVRNKLIVENYALTKANGLLSSVGDKLDAESRLKISEVFTTCADKKQVEVLYEKIVKIIKEKSKKSLNETVQRSKKSTVQSVKVIKESREQAGKNDDMTFEQHRINLLMGYNDNTDYDAYYQFK